LLTASRSPLAGFARLPEIMGGLMRKPQVGALAILRAREPPIREE